MKTEKPINARELQLRERYPNHNIEFVYSTSFNLKDLADNQKVVYGNGRSYYFLLTEIPQQPKQETIEEVAEKYDEQNAIDESGQCYTSFIAGAKHQSEKMLIEQDNFAIGFAEFIANGYSFIDDVSPKTTNKLLQIYKQTL